MTTYALIDVRTGKVVAAVQDAVEALALLEGETDFEYLIIRKVGERMTVR